MRKYSKEEIIQNVKLFIDKHQREPSSNDFTRDNSLPNRKTIERAFGGLKKFRQKVGLYDDHRTGEKRRDVANEINKRAMEWNEKTYKQLLTFFSEPLIHRESSIFDDRRNRTDFKVYGKKTFLVDIFYPKDKASLQGCVRLKANKYPQNLRDYLDKKFDKVIFLNLNNEVSNDIKIQDDFTLMSNDEFWQYCKTMV